MDVSGTFELAGAFGPWFPDPIGGSFNLGGSTSTCLFESSGIAGSFGGSCVGETGPGGGGSSNLGGSTSTCCLFESSGIAGSFGGSCVGETGPGGDGSFNS